MTCHWLKAMPYDKGNSLFLINFLQHLDIPSNPVAIITCSVILMVYIIAVIICKKMDIMDVRRISTIPLCGKDGSFKYEVTIITGRQVGAGMVLLHITRARL